MSIIVQFFLLFHSLQYHITMHLKFLFIEFIVFLVIQVYEIRKHTIILGLLTFYYHNDVPIHKSTLNTTLQFSP